MSQVYLSHKQLEQFKSLSDFVRGDNIPKNKLEQVLKDSIGVHLGHPGILERLNLLRIEREKLFGRTYDDVGWLELCKRYFLTHNFYTDYAIKKYSAQRDKNFQEIERQIYRMKVDQKKKTKDSISELSDERLNFREAEDIFKLTFRNYVDLVSVADRKAALLINVNSIILSVVVAFTIRHYDTHPLFVIPTILLVIVAFGTIYFAISASKPQEEIQKKTGLDSEEIFFFGSFDRVDNKFISLTWEKYKNSMQNIVNGNKAEIVRQITEETFIVRKVLAQKFRYITIAFKIFRYGLMITIASFLVFYLISL
jgi:hypothetical protein